MLNPMSTTLKNHPQQLINVTDYPDPNVTEKKGVPLRFRYSKRKTKITENYIELWN